MSGGRYAIRTILAIVLLVRPAAAESLRFLTEDSGRFSFVEDGEIKGIAVDLVRETAQRAGIEASYDLLPWKRAYEGALGDPETCVFSTTMTSDRLPLFKWVAPLLHNNWALLALKSRHIRLAKLEEALPYVVGVYQGDARETYLHQRGFTLNPVGRNALNLAELEAGRIDLWASSAYTPLQLGPEIANRIETVLEFRNVELGIACNKAVPDATILRLNRVLAEVRADHGYDRDDGPIVEGN